MITDEQIEAMVKVKYPKTDKERNCKQEKAIRDSMRDWYREQLRSKKIDAPTLS